MQRRFDEGISLLRERRARSANEKGTHNRLSERGHGFLSFR